MLHTVNSNFRGGFRGGGKYTFLFMLMFLEFETNLKLSAPELIYIL